MGENCKLTNFEMSTNNSYICYLSIGHEAQSQITFGPLDMMKPNPQAMLFFIVSFFFTSKLCTSKIFQNLKRDHINNYYTIISNKTQIANNFNNVSIFQTQIQLI